MVALRRAVAFVLLSLACVATPVLAYQPAQPQQQNEYVPIDQLPPQDQLPAAPLLISAYSVVMVGLFAYVVSVARRLTTVQSELDRLESDLEKSRRT